LAEKPGVVGKFLQSANSWAPKVAKKIELLPGGVLKGFKKTIIDYLKLLENAGAKSLKFQGNVKALLKSPTAKNIKTSVPMLQNFLKTEKIASGLAKKGPLANIFLGGAPRLFGNRRMRILMRQTKWWLGFLDYINVANFVGPDELASKMGESNIKEKMNQYNQTPEAKKYANEDFGSETVSQEEIDNFIKGRQQGKTTQTTPSSGGGDTLSNFMGKIFGGELKTALLTGL
jgi:hypothetical protein